MKCFYILVETIGFAGVTRRLVVQVKILQLLRRLR